MPEVSALDSIQSTSRLMSRITEYNDASMVICRCTAWCIYYCSGSQYRTSDTTSTAHGSESDYMGSMSILQEGKPISPSHGITDLVKRYSLTKVIQVLGGTAVFLAGLEVGLIFALKVSRSFPASSLANPVGSQQTRSEVALHLNGCIVSPTACSWSWMALRRYIPE
jgi:hypothetical protein